MSDFGFVIFSALFLFLLTSVFWLRFMRSLFDWIGLGPR